jgi:hypothetical protein
MRLNEDKMISFKKRPKFLWKLTWLIRIKYTDEILAKLKGAGRPRRDTSRGYDGESQVYVLQRPRRRKSCRIRQQKRRCQNRRQTQNSED